MSTTSSFHDDPKVAAILEAAFDAFLRFGFKRTSMADIAEVAGMSRAALYLHFKNKDDIFRGMIQAYYADCLTALQAAVQIKADVPDQLAAAFAALTEARFPALLDSPHGAEFLDAKTVSFAAQTAEGDAQIVTALAAWIEQAAQEGRLSYAPFGGTALEVALVLVKAMFGLKSGATRYAGFAADRDRLAYMLGKALAV